MIVLLLGPPGSGKGTQAKRLQADKSWPQLSTGDMLRSAMAEKSELGEKAKSFMERGELVPDDLVLSLIKERVQKPDCQNGFILDGYPRNLAQAETMDRVLDEAGKNLDIVLSFEVEDAKIVDRLTGRRVCSECGTLYHIETSPPKVEGKCDKCGKDSIIQRDDDKASVIRNRLKVYKDQTSPLIEFYTKQGKLKTIDAAQAPDKVYADIIRAVGN